LSTVASTTWGIHYAWTERFDNLVEAYKTGEEDKFGNAVPGLYDKLQTLVNWLIWLRLWVFIILLLVILCFACYIVKSYMKGEAILSDNS
jgi:hypothetical protein